MTNIILFDSDNSNNLLPLTATRPTGELRVGILNIREKWERRLRASVSYITQDYLAEKYPLHITDDNLIICGNILPDDELCKKIESLQLNQALLSNNEELIAARISELQIETLIETEEITSLEAVYLDEKFPLNSINNLWDLTQLNGKALLDDFKFLTNGRVSAPISDTNRVLGEGQIFLEKGVKMECCILNANTGPIYIGENVEVMEGSILRGIIGIGAGSIVKMGAKIYGPTTIGPGCRVGGEISRSIFWGNSNKAHDGYLGDSIIGEWCNLGADTNNSNLKNNYSEVKLWNYEAQRFVPTGQQFFGLVMGDHSKCGINTMFNTGTVVGVCANVYGSGYPRNFIPDFAWGGADVGLRTYKFSDACETIQRVWARRNAHFNDLEKSILFHVYDRTANFRTWEK